MRSFRRNVGGSGRGGGRGYPGNSSGGGGNHYYRRRRDDYQHPAAAVEQPPPLRRHILDRVDDVPDQAVEQRPASSGGDNNNNPRYTHSRVYQPYPKQRKEGRESAGQESEPLAKPYVDEVWVLHLLDELAVVDGVDKDNRLYWRRCRRDVMYQPHLVDLIEFVSHDLFGSIVVQERRNNRKIVDVIVCLHITDEVVHFCIQHLSLYLPVVAFRTFRLAARWMHATLVSYRAYSRLSHLQNRCITDGTMDTAPAPAMRAEFHTTPIGQYLDDNEAKRKKMDDAVESHTTRIAQHFLQQQQQPPQDNARTNVEPRSNNNNSNSNKESWDSRRKSRSRSPRGYEASDDDDDDDDDEDDRGRKTRTTTTTSRRNSRSSRRSRSRSSNSGYSSSSPARSASPDRRRSPSPTQHRSPPPTQHRSSAQRHSPHSPHYTPTSSPGRHRSPSRPAETERIAAEEESKAEEKATVEEAEDRAAAIEQADTVRLAADQAERDRSAAEHSNSSYGSLSEHVPSPPPSPVEPSIVHHEQTMHPFDLSISSSAPAESSSVSVRGILGAEGLAMLQRSLAEIQASVLPPSPSTTTTIDDDDRANMIVEYFVSGPTRLPRPRRVRVL